MFFKNSNPSLPHNHAGLWVCSLNYPLTERWLKPETSTSYHFGVPGSEPPSHREVIETSDNALCRFIVSLSLNHPLTARWLKLCFLNDYPADRVWTTPSPQGAWTENPDIRKDTGIFSIKNLKNAGKLVYIVKGKKVSRNLNYSEKRVDTCLIFW